MLSRVNQSVHLELKVEFDLEMGNSLVSQLVAQRGALFQQVLTQALAQVQEAWLQAVERAEAELVCPGCGVVHVGSHGWVRRGWRARRLQTLAGPLVLPLLQLTCRCCGKTRVADPERVGLEPRQRYSRELKRAAVERVYEMSYRRSAHLACTVWGVKLSASTLHGFVQRQAGRVVLTPSTKCVPLLADGTKVPAGQRTAQEELRLCFQLLGRRQEGGRRRADLRLVGLESGLGSWPEVLRHDCLVDVVVTDAEPALLAHVAACYPTARHQWCEWHVGYTLEWALREDGVRGAQRRRLRRELSAILWGERPVRTKRQLYGAFLRRLPPRSRAQLTRARPHLLFASPSAERTTSLAERQMREVNRRIDVGARWTVSGMRNLMRLALTKRHNPDDYERTWN